MASEPCGTTTSASNKPAPSLFIVSNSCMWPIGTTDRKEGNMNTVTQTAIVGIVGIDVSRDWPGIHCLSDGQRSRLPNTAAGHAGRVGLAKPVSALHVF